MTKKSDMLISKCKDEPNIVKKGRKPKGGKLTLMPSDKVEKYNQITNIILHLKCNMFDLDTYNSDFNKFIKNPLQYDPTIPNDFKSYSANNAFMTYDCKSEEVRNEDVHTDNDLSTSTVSKSECECISEKLKQIKINLYKNCVSNTKSDCFWCTYSFDNTPCYIPKYEIDGTIFGYGSFCRPECAAAFLMKENVDDSTKFERYHLLNNIYAKVYNYKKNIKPAPNPHYLLNKYYGDLTIDEYRSLLNSEHFLQIIEKPMTRILPEMHDDNEDNIEHFYGTENTNNKNMGMYKVKRKTEKPQGPSKNLILREHFGL
jgi:hypothetical protein